MISLGLTPVERGARLDGVGGSDAKRIMDGAWYKLWLEKTGRADPDDLSGVLAVQMGLHTEALNLWWFERQTDKQAIRRGELCIHPHYAFMRATLDAATNDPAVVQAKWCGARAKIAEVEQRYMPQVHHEMTVTGYDLAYLSIITGWPSYELIEVRCDGDYAKTLLTREQEFWSHVESGTPPPDAPPIAAPVPISKWRSVDMTGSNLWAKHAGVWRETIDASRRCEKAAKELRAMIEDDVGEATGHGVSIKRSKDGRSLYIREKTNG